jgi:hypothetical protein
MVNLHKEKEMTHSRQGGRELATKTFQIRYTGINLPILKTVGMGPSFSRVTVTDDHVHVKMGWAINAIIPRSQITSAVRSTKPRLMGWGVHGLFGKWTVNGSDEGIVKLTIDPAIHAKSIIFGITIRELNISLEDPGGFLAELTS